jgi:hypothetical protein
MESSQGASIRSEIGRKAGEGERLFFDALSTFVSEAEFFYSNDIRMPLPIPSL